MKHEKRIAELEKIINGLKAEKQKIEILIEKTSREMRQLELDHQRNQPLTESMKYVVANLREGAVLIEARYHASSAWSLLRKDGCSEKIKAPVAMGLMTRDILTLSEPRSTFVTEYILSDWGKTVDVR